LAVKRELPYYGQPRLTRAVPEVTVVSDCEEPREMISRCRYHLQRALGLAVRPALFAVMRALSQRRELHGVEVWAMADTADDGPLFDRVAEALRLIRESDPLRFARVRRYLRRIIVLDNEAALHIPDIGACALGKNAVLSVSSSRLAASIVHEATHARLRAAGVLVEPRTLEREEVLCVQEAVSFLEKVPGGAGEAERMRALLASELESGRPWFLARRR
jgi:HEXXH motif-containing protein